MSDSGAPGAGLASIGRAIGGAIGGAIVLTILAVRVTLLVFRVNQDFSPTVIQQPTPVPVIETTPTPEPFMSAPVAYVPTPEPNSAPLPTEKSESGWVPPPPTTIYPDVWVTRDGKTYRNVQVQSVEADRVTIIYDQDSIAMVPIENLPLNIKKLLNYDPVEAGKTAAKHFLDQLNDKPVNLDQTPDSKQN